MSTNTTNSIPADWLPDSSAASNSALVVRLCFQAAASAVAWVSLGVADVLITWRVCVQQEPHTGAGILYFLITGFLLCLTILAGTLSYRSWHRLSGVTAFLTAEGRESSEFLSMAGLYVSFTLGAGIIWLGMPLFVLEMCVRNR